MSFLNDRPLGEAIEDTILISLTERDRTICDTWNRDAALAQPFGIKAELAQDEVEEVTKGIKELEGKELLIQDAIKVEFLKGDVRERKGNFTLIYRYKYLEGL